MSLAGVGCVVIRRRLALAHRRGGVEVRLHQAKPLDQAIEDALTRPIRTVSPHGSISRTRSSRPAPFSARPGSAPMSGASGRLYWLTNDGHGRIELQSDSEDVQIVWDPTAISRSTTPPRTPSTAPTRLMSGGGSGSGSTDSLPTLADIDTFPTNLGMQLGALGCGGADRHRRSALPTARRSSPKYDGGLLGLGWSLRAGSG